MKKILSLLVLVLLISGCAYKKGKVSTYEDRIEIIKISEKRAETIENNIERSVIVEEADIEVVGKIIYLEVEYKDYVSKEEAMKDTENYIEHFEEEELEYFDLMINLDGETWFEQGSYNGTSFIFANN